MDFWQKHPLTFFIWSNISHRSNFNLLCFFQLVEYNDTNNTGLLSDANTQQVIFYLKIIDIIKITLSRSILTLFMAEINIL